MCLPAGSTLAWGRSADPVRRAADVWARAPGEPPPLPEQRRSGPDTQSAVRAEPEDAGERTTPRGKHARPDPVVPAGAAHRRHRPGKRLAVAPAGGGPHLPAVCASERLLREVAVNFTLAHNDGSLRTMRWRAEVNKLQGVDSKVIELDDVERLLPFLDTSTDVRCPGPRRPLPPARGHDPASSVRAPTRTRRTRCAARWSSPSSSPVTSSSSCPRSRSCACCASGPACAT